MVLLLLHPRPCFTLLCNLNLSASEFRLLDVLHTEVAAALRVGLLFLPRGNLIVRAVCVGCSWSQERKKLEMLNGPSSTGGRSLQ